VGYASTGTNDFQTNAIVGHTRPGFLRTVSFLAKILSSTGQTDKARVKYWILHGRNSKFLAQNRAISETAYQ